MNPRSDRARILVVEDDASLRRIAEFRLGEAGYEVCLAPTAEEGLAAFASFAPDLIVTDLRMPGVGGEALVDEVLRREPGTPVVVVTGHGTVAGAVRALQRGVADYLTKPVSWDEMLLVVQRVLAGAALRRENRRLRSALEDRVRFEGIVGDSAALRAVFETMDRLRQVDTTVLIEGESGTGKELVAKALHFHGSRRDGPFVAVNCGAIPHDLVESQLFGHERGAFTGAERLHRGYFEQAEGGTLFLDEIGEIPPAAQVTLLRALSERTISRVGGERTIPVDVRVVAATNRDLETAVEEGDFRRDLYYRLAVVPLRMPPLRERRDDVVPLAEAFLARFCGRTVRVSGDAARALRSHRWSGNVRELENVMERASVLGIDGDVLGVENLPATLREQPPPPATVAAFPDDGVDLAQIERQWIERALLHSGGNRSQAARLLGISRQTMLYRMQKHGVDVPARDAEDSA